MRSFSAISATRAGSTACGALAACLCGACADFEYAGTGPSLAADAFGSLRGSQVPVVEARENELRELPLAADRLAAFERDRLNQPWHAPQAMELLLPEDVDFGSNERVSLLPPLADP